MQVIDFLNRYANLLLVVITAVYVFLTWRSIKALERASLHERGMRHFDDMRRHIFEPLIDWIISQAIPRLNGNTPLVQVKAWLVPKQTAPLGEIAYDSVRELGSTFTYPNEAAGELFAHSRDIHFSTQLREFESLRDRIATFSSECVEVAKTCADRIANSTSLRRAQPGYPEADVADSDMLVQICVRDTMLRYPRPRIGFVPAEVAGILKVTDGFSQSVIGRGPESSVKTWAERGVALVQDEWAKTGMQQKIEYLLKQADSVWRVLEAVGFKYGLSEDCEYVGGGRR